MDLLFPRLSDELAWSDEHWILTSPYVEDIWPERVELNEAKLA